MHQLPFNAAIRHKFHIAEVMTAAALEERSACLGVIYDELVRYFTRTCRLIMCSIVACRVYRHEWEEDASKIGAGFDIAAKAGAFNEAALRRARALHDSTSKASANELYRKRPRSPVKTIPARTLVGKGESDVGKHKRGGGKANSSKVRITCRVHDCLAIHIFMIPRHRSKPIKGTSDPMGVTM